MARWAVSFVRTEGASKVEAIDSTIHLHEPSPPPHVLRHATLVAVNFDGLDAPTGEPAGSGVAHFVDENGNEFHWFHDHGVP